MKEMFIQVSEKSKLQIFKLEY